MRIVSTFGSRRRASACAAAAALLGVFAAGAHGAVPWTEASYTYYADKRTVSQVLTDFGQQFGKQLGRSEVGATLNGGQHALVAVLFAPAPFDLPLLRLENHPALPHSPRHPLAIEILEQRDGVLARDAGEIFEGYFVGIDFTRTVQWFDEGNKLLLADTASASECLNLIEAVPELLAPALIPFDFQRSDTGRLVAACELVLEGLYAENKITRNEEGGYAAVTKARKDRRGMIYDDLTETGKYS